MKLSKEEKARILAQRVADKKNLVKLKKEFVKNNKLDCPAKFVSYINKARIIPQRRLGALIDQESTGYIANVISGKKRLTYKHAVLLADVCGMNKGEKVEFYEGVLMQKEGK